MSAPRLRQVVSFVLSLAFGLALLFVVMGEIRGKEEVLRAVMREGLGLYPYLLLSYVSFLLALLVRAHRWQLMLGGKGLIGVGLRAVAVGYLVMLLFSKAGEVARIVFFKKYSGRDYGEITSTVFADRMLDILSFLVVLLLGTYLGEGDLRAHFPNSQGLIAKFSVVLGMGLAGSVGLALAGSAVARRLRAAQILPVAFRNTAADFVDRFGASLRFFATPGRIVYALLSSVIIWIMYFLGFYFVIAFFSCFGGHLELAKGIVVYAACSIGMLMPAPGGLGSYHYFTSLALTLAAGVSREQAISITAFAYLFHVWVPTILMGAGCLLYQFLIGLRTDKRAAS